jgi:hypothetical protein
MDLDLFIQTIHEQFIYDNINYFDPVYLLRNALVLNVWSFWSCRDSFCLNSCVLVSFLSMNKRIFYGSFGFFFSWCTYSSENEIFSVRFCFVLFLTGNKRVLSLLPSNKIYLDL